MAASYVYRTESLARLQKTGDHVLRLERQFGPPHDYPHKMLEKVRRQLPADRAVYRLECQTRAPEVSNADTLILRIPQRNALFAEITRIADERNMASGVVYFGVDDAVGSTNRLSPNLAIPFQKIDVKLGDVWLPLTPDTLAKLSL